MVWGFFAFIDAKWTFWIMKSSSQACLWKHYQSNEVQCIDWRFSHKNKQKALCPTIKCFREKWARTQKSDKILDSSSTVGRRYNSVLNWGHFCCGCIFPLVSSCVVLNFQLDLNHDSAERSTVHYKIDSWVSTAIHLP